MSGASARDSGARRAVVIGASLGGLLAARVASEYVDEVLLLERGSLDLDSGHRKETPHTWHAHGLLASGARELERLFPGLQQAWSERGGQSGDIMGAVRFYANGQRFMRREIGIAGFAVGRSVIEASVRERVLALPQVRVRTGCRVIGLHQGQGRVRGVQVLTEGQGGTAELLAAELVIDASGRASRLPHWLVAAGLPAPAEEHVDMDVRYATVYLRRAPHQLQEDGPCEIVIHAATPERPRPAVIIGQEDGRWVMTLGGYGGDAPPSSREGFLQRAVAQGPEFAQLVRECEWLSDPVSYRMPFSRRRHYEALGQPVAGLVAFADSLCSFNPVFGQGMSVMCLQTHALAECLQAGFSTAAVRRYYKAAAKVIDTAWMTSASADQALPGVPDRRALPDKLIGRYVQRLFRAAAVDADVAQAFIEVSHLLRPPPFILRPSVMFKVWRHGGGAVGRLASG